MKHQDVWAYFRSLDQERIVAWLSGEVGRLSVATVDEEPFLAVYRGPAGVAVRIETGPEPNSLEVTVSAEESADRAERALPWATSPAFARAAAKALSAELLCDPGLEYPDVDPLSDTFLRVTAEGEDLFHWPEGSA